MNPPRVLHLSAAALGIGGVEKFLLGLCSSLAGQANFGLLSAAGPDFESQMQALGVQTFPWRFNGMLDFRVLQALEQTVQAFAPDLVHVHGARSGFLPRFWLKMRGLPVMYTAHLPPYLYRWPRFTSLRRFLYAGMETFLNRALTQIVVYPAHSSYQTALRWGYASASQSRLIPNGIDLLPFATLSSRQPSDQLVIASVARLSPEKNLSLLLSAFARLRREGLPIVLHLAGSGPELSALQTQARAEGVEPWVKFCGVLSEVPAFLSQADIFVLPSWYEGGRSLSAMEAQAAGLACVLSEVGDNRILASQDCALLFPPGDVLACAAALRTLAASPSLRTQIGQRARLRALREYGLPRMAQQYLQVYHSLAGNQA